jgi:hypothetical protein
LDGNANYPGRAGRKFNGDFERERMDPSLRAYRQAKSIPGSIKSVGSDTGPLENSILPPSLRNC